MAAPITRRDGSLVYVLLGAAAAVLSILYAREIGVAIILGLIIIGLIVDLWRDSSTMGARLEALEDSERDKQVLEVEVRQLKERSSQLEAENEDLREQLHSPIAALEPLVEAIHQQVTIIDLVLKHRELAASGIEDCPAVRFSNTGDGQVVVTAFAGDDANRLANEVLTLVRTLDNEVFDSGLAVSGGDRELQIWIDPPDLPTEVADHLRTAQTMQAEGYVLRLTGIMLDDFNATADDLESLRAAYTGALDAMRHTLSQSENAEQTVELGG